MCFQMSGLKSKEKFLMNVSTLQRHHTEQVYTRLNAAHGTKMFLVRWASAAGTTCAQPNPQVRRVSAAAPQGKWGRPRPLQERFWDKQVMCSVCPHTWLKYGGHLPPGPVLQRSQKFCRLEAGSHLWRALKQALGTSKERSNCFNQKAAIKTRKPR